MALKRTVQQKSQVKDPYCMLSIAVIQRMARDAKKGNKKAIAWFESKDYHFYLDYISQSTGIELSYSLRPEI